jgi:SAM-dependent methyltransferase
MNRTNCLICGSTKIDRLVEGQDRNHFIEGRFELDRCGACGFIFLNPTPEPAALARYYPNDYYSYRSDDRPAPAPKNQSRAAFYLRHPIRAANALFYSKILGQNKDLPVRPGLRFLDVGCGDGAYLKTRLREGCECYGVDIGGEALTRLKVSHPEIQTHCGDLWEAKWPKKSFDIVNVCHVLEHVPDPDRLLSEIRRILKPGGLLKVQLPNADSATRILFGRFWQGYETPRHLWVFAPRNLTPLFERNGLRVLRSRTLENSFSVLSSLIHVWNGLAGQKKSLEGTQRIWDSEILKLLTVPYALIVNAFGKGDCLEFIGTPQ